MFFNIAGAKFKIDLIPQSTNLSAISSATSSGVAIIPIATLYFSQTSFIFDIGFTVKPAICLFNFLGSSSKRPTILKPFSLKPPYSAKAEPRFPIPIMIALKPSTKPSSNSSCLRRVITSYPTPLVPRVPR